MFSSDVLLWQIIIKSSLKVDDVVLVPNWIATSSTNMLVKTRQGRLKSVFPILHGRLGFVLKVIFLLPIPWKISPINPPFWKHVFGMFQASEANPRRLFVLGRFCKSNHDCKHRSFGPQIHEKNKEWFSSQQTIIWILSYNGIHSLKLT